MQDVINLGGKTAALDEKGRSSFQLLQIFRSSSNVPSVYFAFDLLILDGKDLREEPLSTRRKLLAKLLEKAPENIRLSGELRGSRDELLRVAQEFGLEELVAKRPNPRCESGRRSSAWVKVKITGSQEFVIGGYAATGGTPEILPVAATRNCKRSDVPPALYQLAGENQRQMGTWDYPSCHETLRVGKTRACRPSQVHRVDS